MLRGRIVFVLLFVCGLGALGSVSAQQTDTSRAGWISDESCGTQHTKPGRADCVLKCWRGGASVGHPEWKPQRAALVPDDDQGIWIVENPEAVRNFPAAHVVLAGKFDSAKKTIHVQKITPVAQQGGRNSTPRHLGFTLCGGLRSSTCRNTDHDHPGIAITIVRNR